MQALVFVGDAMEENVDELGRLAGELGLLGVRAFLFHEGDDPAAVRAFRQIAKLTGGACCRSTPGPPAAARARCCVPSPPTRPAAWRRCRRWLAASGVPSGCWPASCAEAPDAGLLGGGVLVLGLLYAGLRWFAKARAADIALALRTFAAVFSALASTGLLFTGRFGFAVVTVGRHRDGGPRAGPGRARDGRGRCRPAASGRPSRPTCWPCAWTGRPARSTARSARGRHEGSS